MFYKTLRIIKQLIYICVCFHKQLYSFFFSLKVLPLPTAIKTCSSYSMVYLTKWCLFNFWIDLYSDAPKYLFPCPLLTTYPSFSPVPFFLIPTNTPLLLYSQPHNPLFPQAPSPHSCSAPLSVLAIPQALMPPVSYLHAWTPAAHTPLPHIYPSFSPITPPPYEMLTLWLVSPGTVSACQAKWAQSTGHVCVCVCVWGHSVGIRCVWVIEGDSGPSIRCPVADFVGLF